MPNLITHYFFANDVISRLPEHTQQLVERNRAAYNLGSIGPDFLFTLREIGDVSARYSNRMHYHHVYDVFARTAVFLHRNHNEQQIAYMLGLMTHYVIDHRIHPFVNFFAEEGFTSHYGPEYQHYIHNIIESTMDEWILIKNGKNPRTFSVLSCVKAPKYTKKQIGALYREVINKVYRYDISSYKIRFSFNICRLFGVLWMDKYGIKKKLFSWIEDTFSIKKSLSSLLRPPVGYGTVDLLNDNKQPWRIIRNEDAVCDLSFVEMYDIMLNEAVSYINLYTNAMADRKPLNKKDFAVNYEGIKVVDNK